MNFSFPAQKLPFSQFCLFTMKRICVQSYYQAHALILLISTQRLYQSQFYIFYLFHYMSLVRSFLYCILPRWLEITRQLTVYLFRNRNWHQTLKYYQLGEDISKNCDSKYSTTRHDVITQKCSQTLTSFNQFNSNFKSPQNLFTSNLDVNH